MATLRHMAHEKFTDSQLGQLLEDLRPDEESLPYDSNVASLIRITRRQYDRAVQVPAQFMAKFARHRAESYAVWAQARAANDFAAVQPYLEKTLEFSRELANFFPGYEHIADPLIDTADYGMKATTVREIFAKLREQLVPIVDAIASQSPTSDDLWVELRENVILYKHFLTNIFSLGRVFWVRDRATRVERVVGTIKMSPIGHLWRSGNRRPGNMGQVDRTRVFDLGEI